MKLPSAHPHRSLIIARKKTGGPASGESDPRFGGRVREHNPSIPVARCAQIAVIRRWRSHALRVGSTSSGHSANDCEQLRSAQTNLRPPGQLHRDRNCHSTLAAQLGLRWAAKEEQADFYFPPGQGGRVGALSRTRCNKALRSKSFLCFFCVDFVAHRLKD